MPPQKIIIDTDPGVDDMLALLLALSASPEELEVLLISLTWGNTEIENCLRNTVSMFHILEEDRKWRVKEGLRTGYGSLEKFRPEVAVGAEGPLEGVMVHADYFHGMDGLGDVHTTAPHYTPTELWQHLFTATSPPLAESITHPPNFTPISTPSHLRILHHLRTNPPHTITLIAIGPLTNLSLAASSDPATFLLAKEVVLMGGAFSVPGNITPTAEFNHFACAYSTARIYALTSPHPASTLPASPSGCCAAYPDPLPGRRLRVTVFPLDVTGAHLLSAAEVGEVVGPLGRRGSPLAGWVGVFVGAALGKMAGLYDPVEIGEVGGKRADRDLSLHDPMCVWYVLSRLRGDKWVVEEGVDVRVETCGEWTRGMCVVDRRGLKVEESVVDGARMGDVGGWLHRGLGNRVCVVKESPEGCREGLAKEILGRIFGC